MLKLRSCPEAWDFRSRPVHKGASIRVYRGLGFGVYRGYERDPGKEHGNYCLGFGVPSVPELHLPFCFPFEFPVYRALAFRV